MRKGFTLVEMLVVITIIPFVSVALAGLFTTIISDIPRSYRVTQENTNLLSMLRQMHKDIDTAKGLPESFEERTTNNELLLIELADGMICYQLKDGEVLRRKLTDAQQGSSEPSPRRGLGEDTTVWSVPHAKVQWQVWKKDGGGYAVEVKTHIEHKVRGNWQKKMANSHLYFVGAFREVLK